ncbi:mitogen-activated protein kinase 15 isoform X1 [Pteropus medius]|uniref:mitogen-activated protein kinase 15 isoform X1 n=1 Tax=Pteropus vampyrus TaxID=132908 RepID=UPI00196B209C|nr:mitogen-activated protein kinase 15 isoform X1 [Pteropus giganteus]
MCAAEVDDHVAQRYLLKRRLGKGAYGIVWKAVDRRTGEVVAIKKIFDAFKDKMDAQRTFREIMLLQEFGDHPNIIRLLDVIRAENDKDIYLVFESMDTDLDAVIRKGRLLGDVHKRYIFYQLLQATSFIHSGRVIHRDQKVPPTLLPLPTPPCARTSCILQPMSSPQPSNVLLDASCQVKLCDFGLARCLCGPREGPEGQALTEYVATRWYRAPEVLLSSSWYTPGVDMWSLGCILGEMLRGRPLFPGTSTLHQLELVLDAVPPPSEEDLLALGSGYSAWIRHHLGTRPRQTLATLLPPDTPPEALDLLRRLLVFTPDKRLSAAQALQHPYVQRFYCPAHEWTLAADVRLPVQEGVQLTAAEYRDLLYQMILERRGHCLVRSQKGLGGGPPPQERPLKARAAPQLPSGRPAQSPGHRPQNSPGHDAAPDTPGGAPNVLRQDSAPLLQPSPPRGSAREGRSPGAAAESPSAPPWVEPREGVAAAPSLTSQAAAQVAIRALIRSDPAPGRGVRAAGARQVSPPAPALPSPPFAASRPLRPRARAAGPSARPVQAPDEDLRPRAGPSPAFPAAPARPQDVRRLGLAGGPGGREGRARRLLPSLWHRLLLGAGPPAPAPRAPRVSRAITFYLALAPGTALSPAPLRSACGFAPGTQSSPLLFHSMGHFESQEACSVFSGGNEHPPQPQPLPPIKSPLSPAHLLCPSFTLGEGLGAHPGPRTMSRKLSAVTLRLLSAQRRAFSLQQCGGRGDPRSTWRPHMLGLHCT